MLSETTDIEIKLDVFEWDNWSGIYTADVELYNIKFCFQVDKNDDLECVHRHLIEIKLDVYEIIEVTFTQLMLS